MAEVQEKRTNNQSEENLTVGEMLRLHVISRKRAEKIARRGVSPAAFFQVR